MTREHWSSKAGFILAAIGSAVGLGVLWKFPYTVGQNGGGLFLLAYIACIILVGIPVFVGELFLGRRSQRASVGAFAKLSGSRPGWKFGGYLGMLSSFLIMSFYSVIAGYGMNYIFMSLCDFSSGKSAQDVVQIYKTLFASADISVMWHLIFTTITVLIVVSGVRKGIEYWSRLMTRALFVILLAIVAFNTTLDGFKPAIEFIFYPNIDKFQFSSILEALGLAFFTMSLGQGIMISYGSYMREDEKLPNMAVIVGFSVIVVSLLAALAVFPVVFTYGFAPSAGPGLIFETLPFLFDKLPGGIAFSTIFFTLFTFTAITSSVAFVEVVAANLMEMFNWDRKFAVYATGCATFLFGIPCALSGSGLLFPEWQAVYGTDFIDTVNNFVSVWIIPVCGLMTALFIGWEVDRAISRQEFDGKMFNVWHFFMRYLIPVLILLIILQTSGLIDFDALIKG